MRIDWADVAIHAGIAVISTTLAGWIWAPAGIYVAGFNACFWPYRESVQKGRGFRPWEWSLQVHLEAWLGPVLALAVASLI